MNGDIDLQVLRFSYKRPSPSTASRAPAEEEGKRWWMRTSINLVDVLIKSIGIKALDVIPSTVPGVTTDCPTEL